MRNVWVRPYRDSDKEDLCKWLGRIADINLVDSDVLSYPSTVIWAAEKGGETILYMPVQQTVMLESLAPAPECSPIDEALALKAMVSTAVWEARKSGHGEIYFLCKDPRVEKFSQAHGFEKIDIPLFRLKLNKLP